MSALRPLTVLGALALLIGPSSIACEQTSEPLAGADVCARATHLFSSCGVVLPTLTDTPCTGAARLVARCVVDHAKDCDGLASLAQRLDACVEDRLDGGDLLPPPADLPVPLADPDDDDATDAGDAGDAADGAPLTDLGDHTRSRTTVHSNPKVMT